VKADLLEKYRAKQQEVAEVEAKLLRLLQGEHADESELALDDDDFGHATDDDADSDLQGQHQLQMQAISQSGGRVLIDKRAEKRLRDKLNRHTKNLADLRRKLIEEDKRERARRRKVRAKRGEAFGRRESSNSSSSTPQQHAAMAADELFMEDWETILTRSNDEAEHYLNRFGLPHAFSHAYTVYTY
jgi:phosphatidate phosphatase PAH1